MSSVALYLGMDGGGTSTRAVLATAAGEVVGVGKAGGSNPNSVGEAAAVVALRTAVDNALSDAGAARADVAATFIGLAGIVDEADHALARNIAVAAEVPHAAATPSPPSPASPASPPCPLPPHRSPLPSHPLHFGMHHDIHVALVGGLVGHPGIALIAGTGSSCYGVNAGGTSCQTGGFGTILDDGGSAYGLGLGALRVAVRVADGRIGASALQRRVLDALGLADLRGIVQKVYQSNMSKADIAALATLTLDAWAEGDPAARAVVEEQASELALLVTTAARRLGLTSPLVTYAGSVLERSEPYRQLVGEMIHRTIPTARVVAPELPPVLGALLLAYDGAGVRHDARTHGRMRATYEKEERARG